MELQIEHLIVHLTTFPFPSITTFSHVLFDPQEGPNLNTKFVNSRFFCENGSHDSYIEQRKYVQICFTVQNCLLFRFMSVR
jgi:hypothetical protein